MSDLKPDTAAIAAALQEFHWMPPSQNARRSDIAIAEILKAAYAADAGLAALVAEHARSGGTPAAAPDVQPLDGTEPTIYVSTVAPLRKDGSPVLGNFGARIGKLVIMDMATWKRLCAENPGLQTTRFRVGDV